jgi:hypothetical protein
MIARPDLFDDPFDDSGVSSRIYADGFMAELISDDATWMEWR